MANVQQLSASRPIGLCQWRIRYADHCTAPRGWVEISSRPVANAFPRPHDPRRNAP
ncbi:hypothetical protein [Hoylesella pleuritidis]|uniref:hypothetical protein n=1 Tax=Hoylesella pleuritidis TaxID=407975 RepID=UPI0012DDDB65|nr:hypothetical protein [Hoylesella pleuritidis]